MDRYKSYVDLSANEQIDVDYRIVVVDRGSPAVILAPHGGGIEPTTSEIADAIAGETHSLYCFEGVDQSRPHRDLHITSENFDEPRGRALAAKAQFAVAIHGRANESDGETTWLGGRDAVLIKLAAAELEKAGFTCLTEGHKLPGKAQQNICNSTKTGGGLQLEIPRALRDKLRGSPGALASFATAVRAALNGRASA